MEKFLKESDRKCGEKYNTKGFSSVSSALSFFSEDDLLFKPGSSPSKFILFIILFLFIYKLLTLLNLLFIERNL